MTRRALEGAESAGAFINRVFELLGAETPAPPESRISQEVRNRHADAEKFQAETQQYAEKQARASIILTAIS